MKHLHMTLAVISIALFIVRFAWTIKESQMLQKKWVKIAPHIIDTFLLGIGIAMAIKLAINPLEYLWLAEKIIAIVAYIFTGYFTLKLARNRMMQMWGFFGAMGWVVVIFSAAITKQTIFF